MRVSTTCMALMLVAAGCPSEDFVSEEATCSWAVESAEESLHVQPEHLAWTARGLRAVDGSGAVVDVEANRLETPALLERVDGVFVFDGDLYAYGAGAWVQTSEGWDGWFRLHGHRIVHATADDSGVVMLVNDGLASTVWRFDRESGERLPQPPITLLAYVAIDGDETWAVGTDRAARWDGSEWTVVDLPDVAEHIVGVFDGELVFTGRWDVWMGRDAFESQGEPGEVIRSAWGTGPDDLWLGTDDGVYHFDGSSWILQETLGAAVGGASNGESAWSLVHDDQQTLVVATDDAVVWQARESGSAPGIALQADGTAWLADGLLYKRVDGEWQPQDRVARAVRTRGNEVFVAGDGIARSTDGGLTWSEFKPEVVFSDVLVSSTAAFGVGYDLFDLDSDTSLWVPGFNPEVALLGHTPVVYTGGRVRVWDEDQQTWRRLARDFGYETAATLYPLDGGALVLAVDGLGLFEVTTDTLEPLETGAATDVVALWGRGRHDFFVANVSGLFRNRGQDVTTELVLGGLAVDGDGDDVIAGNAQTFLRGTCR